MTAQLLTSELNNLIQESKRKHNDLRQAADKSLDELKSLKASSEAQTGPELAQRVNFVNPFIIACGTKNVKFTGIAIVCLQRLIVSRALPRSRLNQVLEALQQATSAGLDVQLKILQALPSLVSNYAAELQGELLVTALNICFILQSSKNAIVNNTSAATLQQLVVSVFDKVVTEDKSASSAPPAGDAQTQDGPVSLKAAALDAYRVFNDLCLLTENQRPEYLRFSGLTQTFGLELIESVLTNHAAIFSTHPEQAYVLRTRVMPFIISSLGGKPTFATGVRLFRILYTLLRRHLAILPSASGEALDILIQILDQDPALWKRALCMEVFRGIFAEAGLLRRMFAVFDDKEGEKDVLKHLMATFVRVSTEKPTVIGLGHQSTIPVANSYSGAGSSTDQAMLEASGVTGIISGSVGGSDGPSTGISTQWSSMRVPCIDQLDKTEPPAIPESYIYGLTLSCITSLSEGLAKFVLPLTVPTDGRSRKRVAKQDARRDSTPPADEKADAHAARATLSRSASATFKKNPVPINPLMLKDHPLHADIKICAALVDECWPAILATCSTFLYAALDSEYYHGLVRSFQKLAHVAGLLQLPTPRDAFLTTLGKAAVPPNVLTACLNAGSARPAPSSTGADSPHGILNNARGLLSVDSLVSQSSQSADRSRQPSMDAGPSTLNTRNLLCLRALLNLGIALGPTLSASWQIVLETLQQADFVLFSTGKSAGRTPTASSRASDQQAEQEATTLHSNFNTEIRAVETAASRLFESTVDFPNPAFVEVVVAVCNLLDKPTAQKPRAPPPPSSPSSSQPSSRPQSPATAAPAASSLTAPSVSHRRVLSISTSAAAGPNQEDQFALAKLGDLASINLERLLTYPPDVSGWTPLMDELTVALGSALNTAQVRLRAADTLVRIVMEAAKAVTSQPEEPRGAIQKRLLVTLRDAIRTLQARDCQTHGQAAAADVDIHRAVLEGLRGILENVGESLVSGWEVTFEIVDTIFADDDPPRLTPAAGEEEGDPRSPRQKPLATRSLKLIRPSFASLQLVCSDFLPSLPNSCFLNLVDTLYKFCSQNDDLNVALTTVTFFWAISDFLSGKGNSISIAEDMVRDSGDDALLRLAADPSHPGSSAALWMLLLLRLTSVATDQRLELRNSAIQTLMRIISAYGDTLSPEAWVITICSVIFRLLASIEDELRAVGEAAHGGEDSDEWQDTAIVVIQGVSGLFTSYLGVLATHQTFTSVWRSLLGHFATMLNFQILHVNAAVFGAMRDILARCNQGEQHRFAKDTVDLAWDLWSRDTPTPPGLSRSDAQGPPPDNQRCLLVWVESLLELYHLAEKDLDVDRVRRMLVLLREATRQAALGAYVSDVDQVTPLQGRILEVLRMIRTDIPGVPAAIVAQVAEFVSLAFAPPPPPQQQKQQQQQQQPRQASASPKRTYIAMSKESMGILESLITANAGEPEIYTTGAFATALSSLAQPITLKYGFPVPTKTTPPWRVATSCFLSVLEVSLSAVRAVDMPRDVFQDIWRIVVTIAGGIVSAECNKAPAPRDLFDDQEFDIASFCRLRGLIVPSLGTDAVPDATRRSYAEALFRTSIIHMPPPAEAAVIFGAGTGDPVGLGALYKQRSGRTIDPDPTNRSKMAYVCLDELFSLVAAHDESAADATPTILVQPPTPRFPRIPPQNSSAAAATADTDRGGSEAAPAAEEESAHVLHVRLARTAAPYLILRCALSIRAYIADQPLRGRMPQPLSQRRELTRILQHLVDLRSEPDAIPDAPNVESEARKHLLRLYPLLVAAGTVAGSSGDEKVLHIAREALDVVGGELGV